MRKFTVASAAAILLAACGGSDEGTIETTDGESVDYEIDSDGSSSEVRITGEDGEEVVINSGSGASGSVDLPDGYSLYPGASVVSTATINEGGGQGRMVMMQSDDTPEEMAAFYRQQAEAAGIEIQMEMTTNGSSMIVGEDGSGGSFSFNATPSDNGTLGQLMIGRDFD